MSEIQDNPLDLSMNSKGEVQFQEDDGLWRPFVTQATQDTEEDSLVDASEENFIIDEEEESSYIIPHQVNDINGGEKLEDLTSGVVTQATQDADENSLIDDNEESYMIDDTEESSFIIPHQLLNDNNCIIFYEKPVISALE